MCEYVCGCGCHGHLWSSEDNLWFSPSTVRVPRIELRLSGLVASVLIRWATGQPPLCFKGSGREKSCSLARWFGKGRVVFRGLFGGLPRPPSSCSSSCWEQSEGGIMFLLVTLPRMRGNPQSVGLGGGVGIGWQVMGQGN